jgi:arylformamidase
MQASIQYKNETYRIDFSKPLDISLSLRGDDKNPVAWYLKAPKIEPVKEGNWIGKVSKGGSVNFNNIYFNPHGHTTHTECVGHITSEYYGINESLKTFFFSAKLISVEPVKSGEDEVITKDQLKKLILEREMAQAVIIRTLPNSIAKRSKHYSHTNWPYLHGRRSGLPAGLRSGTSVDRSALCGQGRRWRKTSGA